VNDRDVEVLSRAPLFEALDEDAARALRGIVTEVHLSRGQTLFSEDQEGDRLYQWKTASQIRNRANA